MKRVTKAATKRKGKRKSLALARRADVAPLPAGQEQPLAIIERVAKDPDVDVDKLGKLIELQKDMMRVQSKVDFDQAFAMMAPQLPVIKKGGVIRNKQKEVQSRYARLSEDIHPVLKPVLNEYGFAIRHRTEWPQPNLVRVIGILSHRSGHSEESAFEAPADKSDYRSHVQSLGSTVSYGRRYTTIDLLNLTVLGTDDDGQRGAEPPPPADERRPPPPAQRHAPPPDVHHAALEEAITQSQRQRLATIVNNSSRSDEEVREWLVKQYGLPSDRPSTHIKRKDYDAICTAIESPGKLVVTR